jgi:hypothetical protein
MNTVLHITKTLSDDVHCSLSYHNSKYQYSSRSADGKTMKYRKENQHSFVWEALRYEYCTILELPHILCATHVLVRPQNLVSPRP